MKRVLGAFRWARMVLGASAVLALILVVALWDTVVMGRDCDEQLDREGGK